ncbi:MAG: DUF11 domain-containing protein [Chloroflexi bacterium]|nr:DUF11 domain-containing protein [Chloroflexota bacterium]
MSARKALVLLSLLLLLGILFTLPSSTQAANRGPNQPSAQNNVAVPPDDDDTVTKPSKAPPVESESAQFLEARDNYYLLPRLAGTNPLSLEDASELQLEATQRAMEMRANAPEALPKAYGGAWDPRGPNPIIQIQRTTFPFTAVSGRIGAVLILPNGQYIIGAAQGGIWTWAEGNYEWTPRTDNIGSMSIGSLAYAPSNPSIVYAGTGEGHLSGDNIAGNGILKSTDGGFTWAHVSGKQLVGMSTSAIVVDPDDANHLYVATLRGRGGVRRVTHPVKRPYGIYESFDGGATWTLLKGYNDQFKGATDLEMDPQNKMIMYSSFWGTGIFKSTDGGQTWSQIMNGLPTDAVWDASPTRFALGLSHPTGQGAVLYTGFDYIDTNGETVLSHVWKSTDEGANWFQTATGTNPDNVEDYCGGQCWYDNVIAVDPTNPDIVFALGQFKYYLGSGGFYRSDDGGNNWLDIACDQHPDFQAFAFNPSDPNEVIYGSDAGVWRSMDQGGRHGASPPLCSNTWEDLNGTVDPNTAAVYAQTGLQITQFTGVSTIPTIPNRLWGGSQDNGTERKFNASNPWYDFGSGDGGYTLVDPTNGNYAYGTYFGITPYRFTVAAFFANEIIRTGIDLSDRAEFYIPWVMNKLNPQQLFLGTYRVYRTNNAKAADSADVLWEPISSDLTSGCTGTAPNGGRGCLVSALAVSAGGHAVWAGTEEGWVQYSASAVDSANPKWNRVDHNMLPGRPVQSIAVDQSNARRALVAFGGYNQATPGFPGHLFLTNDAGKHWQNVSGNLPNIPVNSVIMDPSYPDTFYIGTDVGPFVTNNGGASWDPLGTGFPIVQTVTLDLDPWNRILAAGTHGRGAWRLVDNTTLIPGLVLEKTYPDTPIGPDTDVTFNITVTNMGNADATGVTITDKISGRNTFVSADNGGHKKKGSVVWENLTVPAGDSITVSEVWHISASAKKNIKNKNYTVTSAEGVGAKGTPRVVKLAKPKATMLSPESQSGAGKPGSIVDYTLTVRNMGYQTDSFKLKGSGMTYPTEIRDATCATVINQTGSLAPGATEDICIRVYVANAAKKQGKNNNNNNKQGKQGKAKNAPAADDTVTIQAQSASDNQVKATATINTIQVINTLLLVDQDGNNPDVRAYYTAMLDAFGQPYDVWDLNTDPVFPINYLNAYTTVVWFTGNTWPQPITAYEGELTSFLDNGGRLFMSGQDLLDQAGGTTTFVHDYLHVNWDGSEAQNDKPYASVTGVGGNPVTNGIGAVPLDSTVLGNTFMDYVTLVAPATAAFTEPGANDVALTVDTGTYKVMFFAFGVEEYGNATQKADLFDLFMAWANP